MAEPNHIPVAIVPMTSFDVPTCAEIMSTSELYQRYSVDYEQTMRFLLQSLDHQEYLYVAKAEETVFGFVGFALRNAFYYSGYVHSIAVREEYRRRHLGETLLHFAEEKIFAQDPNVFVLVADFNLPAQKFYGKLGYEKVGKLPGYYLSGVVEYIYRKTKGAIIESTSPISMVTTLRGNRK